MNQRDNWMRQYGEIAYNAYWDHAGGVTFDGRGMPRWDQLGDAVQSHWIRAATVVATRAIQRGTTQPLDRSEDVSRETSTEVVPNG